MEIKIKKSVQIGGIIRFLVVFPLINKLATSRPSFPSVQIEINSWFAVPNKMNCYFRHLGSVRNEKIWSRSSPFTLLIDSGQLYWNRTIECKQDHSGRRNNLYAATWTIFHDEISKHKTCEANYRIRKNNGNLEFQKIIINGHNLGPRFSSNICAENQVTTNEDLLLRKSLLLSLLNFPC